MARKKPIRVRVANSGATVNVAFPRCRLEEVLSHLPEGELRTLLLDGTEKAERRGRTIAADKRMEVPLSLESLEPFGWDPIGDPSRVAFAAIRQGDFRLATAAGRTGWEFGRTGAFDREPEGTQIVRHAFQAGVFSERQAAYRLLDPTLDRASAIAAAGSLAAEWTDATRGMPVAKADVFDLRRMSAMTALPEGAVNHMRRPPYSDVVLHHARRGDETTHVDGRGSAVHVFPCEAVLRQHRVFDEECDRALVVGTRYCVGRRADDPRYSNRDDLHLLDGPYDVVLGSSWAAWTDASPPRDDQPWKPQWASEAVGMLDRTEALAAAADIAARYRVTAPAPLADAA